MDEDDLVYSGPGEGDEWIPPEPVSGTDVGGMPQDVAAYGSGGLGALLMALTGWLKRRRSRPGSNGGAEARAVSDPDHEAPDGAAEARGATDDAVADG